MIFKGLIHFTLLITLVTTASNSAFASGKARKLNDGSKLSLTSSEDEVDFEDLALKKAASEDYELTNPDEFIYQSEFLFGDMPEDPSVDEMFEKILRGEIAEAAPEETTDYLTELPAELIREISLKLYEAEEYNSFHNFHLASKHLYSVFNNIIKEDLKKLPTEINHSGLIKEEDYNKLIKIIRQPDRSVTLSFTVNNKLHAKITLNQDNTAEIIFENLEFNINSLYPGWSIENEKARLMNESSPIYRYREITLLSERDPEGQWRQEPQLDLHYMYQSYLIIETLKNKKVTKISILHTSRYLYDNSPLDTCYLIFTLLDNSPYLQHFDLSTIDIQYRSDESPYNTMLSSIADSIKNHSKLKTLKLFKLSNFGLGPITEYKTIFDTLIQAINHSKNITEATIFNNYDSNKYLRSLAVADSPVINLTITSRDMRDRYIFIQQICSIITKNKNLKRLSIGASEMLKYYPKGIDKVINAIEKSKHSLEYIDLIDDENNPYIKEEQKNKLKQLLERNKARTASSSSTTSRS